jgi:hypothetical protein
VPCHAFSGVVPGACKGWAISQPQPRTAAYARQQRDMREPAAQLARGPPHSRHALGPSSWPLEGRSPPGPCIAPPLAPGLTQDPEWPDRHIQAQEARHTLGVTTFGEEEGGV